MNYKIQSRFRRLIAFAAFAVVAPSSSLFPLEPKKEATADAALAQLRARKLPSREKQLLTGTDSGGSLVLFFDRGQIVRLTVTIGLSNRSVTDDLFFKDGRVIMSEYLTRFDVFDSRDQSLHSPKKGEEGAEIREVLTFRDEKLVRWNLQSTLPKDQIPI